MSLLDTDLLLHTEGQYASANKNTCTNTHILICCQQSQRWVISPIDYIKKNKNADLSSSALPSSFLSPGQSSTTLPGHLQDYSPLQPGQDHYSLPALCLSITAQPSVRQPSTESSSHGWSRHWPLRTERRTSHISNRCKEHVCDLHICFSQCHNATGLNTQSVFCLYALACAHQVLNENKVFKYLIQSLHSFRII